MLASLGQAEEDRALLLAGVSHDLRTPLARLRLGIEVGAQDASTREGMIADIAEMDKIIGQFLEFARDNREAPLEMRELNDIVASAVERYQKAGNEVRFSRGELPELPLRSTAMSRLIANLIDNALAYGAPPVDVVTRRWRLGGARDIRSRARHRARPGPAAEAAFHARRACAHRRRRCGAGGLRLSRHASRACMEPFELLPREGWRHRCAQVTFASRKTTGS
jgi:two-component system osmolarity sensor histidine kinase EnvZ